MLSLASALAGIVGKEHVLAGEAIRGYLSDATEAQGLRGSAEAVVLPATLDEIIEVVGWCATRGITITPRGGGTGYAGGCVPAGGIVLATDRLNRIRKLEPLLWRAELEAGVTTRRLQRVARENGLSYPVDPGAAEQSHLGGNLATNAGGPHAFKYGVTGAWVTGIEAVLASGEMIQVGAAIRKDVAGYDLRSLLVGSEGTLAIITAAQLRLIPAIQARFPVVGFYNSTAVGCEGMEAAMACGVVPAAIEYLDKRALSITSDAFPAGVPAGATIAVIAEADGTEEEAAIGRSALIEALQQDAVQLYAPQSSDETHALWRWRDGVGIAVDGELGGKVSEDIVVPLDRLGEAIERTVAIGHSHGLAACSWGHAGDGNLHSTLMFDRADSEQLDRATHAVDDLFALAVELGGSVSGEHGLGLVKSGQLRRQWRAPALALHTGIKHLFDPSNLLNRERSRPK